MLGNELKINEPDAIQVAKMYRLMPIRKLLQAVDLAAERSGMTVWKEFYDEFQIQA